MKVDKRRFKHWAYLNEEGEKIWSDVFPDSKVPVLSMIPKYGSLGSPEATPQHYFVVYVRELSDEQIEGILDILTEKFNAPREEMRTEFMEHGIPLRQSLTNGSGTNHPGLFL